MTQTPNQRVAVVGASGIGKHHANWWRMEGAHVCAFMGATSESVIRTRAMLRDTLGMDIPGYTDLSALIETEAPDIVDVCSPPELHGEHTRTALEHGRHVLCEKPFLFDSRQSADQLLHTARELRDLASRQGVQLGVCAQYAAGAPLLVDAARPALEEVPLDTFTGQVEAPSRGRAPEPDRIWVDLSPHPLSVLQTLVPGVQIDWDRCGAVFEGFEASARFRALTPEGRSIACEIITRNTTAPPDHVRRFAFNGYDVRVEGERDAEGVYGARLETVDGAHSHPDFLRLLIRAFLARKVVFTAEMAVTNLEWMVHLMQCGRA